MLGRAASGDNGSGSEPTGDGGSGKGNDSELFSAMDWPEATLAAAGRFAAGALKGSGKVATIRMPTGRIMQVRDRRRMSSPGTRRCDVSTAWEITSRRMPNFANDTARR